MGLMELVSIAAEYVRGKNPLGFIITALSFVLGAFAWYFASEAAGDSNNQDLLICLAVVASLATIICLAPFAHQIYVLLGAYTSVGPVSDDETVPTALAIPTATPVSYIGPVSDETGSDDETVLPASPVEAEIPIAAIAHYQRKYLKYKAKYARARAAANAVDHDGR